jgi:TPP-dependent trihydroxycyclohexane-1,2-dione (THcHDO) dehydratase
MTLAQARTKILAASTANADVVVAISQHVITVDGSGNVANLGTAFTTQQMSDFASALPGLPQ